MTTATYTPSFTRARAPFDRPIMLITLALLIVGMVLSLSATPTITQRLDAGNAFALSMRHALFLLGGLCIAALAAFADARMVRRTGFIIMIGAALLMAMTLIFTPERNGAARWLDLGPISIQPSEALKPALVIFWAWMLSEQMRNPAVHGRAVALGAFALAAILLMLQPDLGQTILLFCVLAAMMILSGLNWRLVAGLGGVALAAPFVAYQFFPHARARIDAFLGEPGYQVSRALEAIQAGGLFGRGPGEGVVKRALPDAHADFIYAVAAEEFGLMMSLGLIALYAAFAWRGYARAAKLIDPFQQLATAGLVTLICAQAVIHIAVNTSLAPAKGMTLPFVSYGGSAMLGACFSVGCILALTRARPDSYLHAEDLR